MIRRLIAKPLALSLIPSALLVACSTHSTLTSKDQKPSPEITNRLSHQEQPAMHDFRPSTNSFVPPSDSRLALNDDDDDEEDLDRSEMTPNDLGDVQASEKLKDEEVTADALSTKTFPLVYNEFVQQWIKYFTGRGKPVFERYLARSTRYIPMMQQVLREEGLPEDLIYLAMCESGFQPSASSRVKAVGPWQFMRATGKRYGLTVNYFKDERRDYRKSTFAAAKYLKELHQIFGSWYLAAAAYNAGEGKVLSAVRRDRSRNFWELARRKKNFRGETRNYVPKIVAAALISKNPEKYGFDHIDYENPLAWESVAVPGGVDIKQIADLLGTDKETLHMLNTELRRDVTPPGTSYDLRVPPEKKELLVSKLSELQPHKLGTYSEYTVKRGESWQSIAHRHHLSVKTLLMVNDLRRPRRLKPGTEITLPVGGAGALALASNEPALEQPKARKLPKLTRRFGQALAEPEALAAPKMSAPVASASAVAESSADGLLRYQVKEGDSLWKIAQEHGTTVAALRKANNFGRRSKMRAGITILVPKKSDRT